MHELQVNIMQSICVDFTIKLATWLYYHEHDLEIFAYFIETDAFFNNFLIEKKITFRQKSITKFWIRKFSISKIKAIMEISRSNAAAHNQAQHEIATKAVQRLKHAAKWIFTITKPVDGYVLLNHKIPRTNNTFHSSLRFLYWLHYCITGYDK